MRSDYFEVIRGLSSALYNAIVVDDGSSDALVSSPPMRG